MVYPPGKPIFPEAIIKQQAASLESFLGTNSWLIFHLLGIDHAWLNLPVEEWTHTI
jgi:hypothetical protein